MVAMICLIASVNKVFAQNPIVKIDFDQSGRPKAEVNDPDYTAWVIASGNTSSYTENGVTFTISRTGTNGDNLGTNWYKAGIQAPYYARLVCDGLTVKGTTANLGAQIELKISGLATGEHTLLAFFNNVDSPTTNTFSPIDISVDGNVVVNNLIPTVRATKTADAASSYLRFQATAGTDVVILIAAETSGTENVKNFIFNGFELNTPNISHQAINPDPKQNNEHVELVSGGKLLQWTAGSGAVSHNVYFGTDATAVDNATTASPEFKGNQALANNSYQANGLYTGATYYWRIDEVLSNGIEKGNVWRFRPAQLAFPDAEGYGRFARGGRGGKVVAVTNLNDSGPGSFREAVTNDIGPRTIVFNTSGVIQLQSRLVLSQPYVTVAGQTAPGKGICIRSAPFGVTGNDAVVQNLRVRVGAGPTFDGMGLTGADNSIIDHCSISWTIDESFSSRSGKNITLQRTLISEALNAANHQNYPAGTEHGYAATIGGDIGSFHHNLLAHCYGRNWSLGGGLDGNGAYAGKMDITNNVVYNWGGRTTDGGTKEVNFVNNYYKPGAGSKIFVAFNQQNEGVGTGMQQCYFNGNVMPGYFDETNQTAGRKASGNTVPYNNFVNTPFFPSYVTTQSAKNAYKIVLSDVGCTQPEFDEHDQRIISETLNGTYSAVGSVTGKPGFPDNEADVGGFENYPTVVRDANWDSDQDGLPNWWENIIGTNVNSAIGDFSDANADPNLDGYTHLDEYLQWMSLPHYESPDGTKIDINIQKLSRGFTSGVSYAISNVVNGNAILNTDVVAFTPTSNGLCSFEFTVTDSEGGTMKRKVNVISGQSLTLGTDDSIKETKNSVFNVWPIPSNGSFSVFIHNEEAEILDLKIYDISGKELVKQKIKGGVQETIQLHSKGVFLIKVVNPQTKKTQYVKKIIIQ
ncbi:T9SS type A sorting domain-containing protein [Flavobacterium tyrosinilyticum]|uniref:T9SS type A sorting domain-containing protein n=1 Tax=Flavobacterium tyrosinilyticum TaxID=1658740 RepID=UPI002030B655|nr:T9SS type A sorting domain-containing protein [Flavobacterium tyrosinilyticum]MCM0666411.1 T9SS type A sorting domain-containing protein [Flavobacterium tyrosinilyticum]